MPKRRKKKNILFSIFSRLGSVVSILTSVFLILAIILVLMKFSVIPAPQLIASWLKPIELTGFKPTTTTTTIPPDSLECHYYCLEQGYTTGLKMSTGSDCSRYYINGQYFLAKRCCCHDGAKPTEGGETTTTTVASQNWVCCIVGRIRQCVHGTRCANGLTPITRYSSEASCKAECGSSVTTTTVSGSTTTTTVASSCSDSDGGINYGLKGLADDTYHYNNMWDYCVNEYGTWGRDLYEYYCQADGTFTFQMYTCPSVCVDGRCKVPSGTECYETDAGTNYATKGYVVTTGYPNWEFYDWCSADSFPDQYSRRYLTEQTCVGGSHSVGYTCPNTPCYNGACQDYNCPKDMGLPGNRVYVDNCNQCPQNLQCQNECYSYSTVKKGFYKCWVVSSVCVIGVNVPGYADTPC